MRRLTHAIADIVFTDDESMLICTCGDSFATDSPETVNQPFQDHRVAAGEQRRSFSSADMAPVGGTTSWRDGNTVTAAARYRDRHPERVREQQRRYRERKREDAA